MLSPTCRQTISYRQQERSMIFQPGATKPKSQSFFNTRKKFSNVQTCQCRQSATMCELSAVKVPISAMMVSKRSDAGNQRRLQSLTPANIQFMPLSITTLIPDNIQFMPLNITTLIPANIQFRSLNITNSIPANM